MEQRFFFFFIRQKGIGLCDSHHTPVLTVVFLTVALFYKFEEILPWQLVLLRPDAVSRMKSY